MKKRTLILSCVLLLLLSAFALAACNDNTKEDYSNDPIIGTYIGACNTDQVHEGYSYYVTVSFDESVGYFVWDMTVAQPPTDRDPVLFRSREWRVGFYNTEKDCYSMTGDFSLHGTLAIEYRPLYEVKIVNGILFVSGTEKDSVYYPDGQKINYMFEKTNITEEQFREQFRAKFE